MNGLARGSLALVSGIAAFFFAGWLGAALLSILLPAALAFVLSFLASMLGALLVVRHVWRWSGAASRGRASSVLGSAVAGAAIVGGIAFCAGFFGPIIFAPGANQGPLLGIFITGPLGVVAGAVGGGLYGLGQTRQRSRS
jgi:hypothetical protein